MEVYSDTIDRNTSQIESDQTVNNLRNMGASLSRGVSDAAQEVSDVLTLAQRWIWIGKGGTSIAKRDESDDVKRDVIPADINEPLLDRFDYERMYSLKLDDYFMPVSQTYSLRARKTLNESNLVDGPTIIQQTRKQSKTIDCMLRISLLPEQTMLQPLDGTRISAHAGREESVNAVAELGAMLERLYEDDTILLVSNKMINDTFKVRYAIMSEYRFEPRPGANTYTISFSLTEVKYEENAVTFDLRELNSN